MITEQENVSGKIILIENFKMTPLQTVPKENDGEREALCGSLGLVQQRLRAKESRLNIPYPRLSDEELNIWGAFLPTAYSSYPRPYSGVPSFSQYAFDEIPLTALRIIQEAQESRAFFALEIWTPEKKRIQDPIAVGVVKSSHASSSESLYLLCRWGESLIPFEEIKEIVRRRRQSWFSRMIYG